MSFPFSVHIADPVHTDQPLCGASLKAVVLVASPSESYPACTACTDKFHGVRAPTQTIADALKAAFADDDHVETVAVDEVPVVVVTTPTVHPRKRVSARVKPNHLEVIRSTLTESDPG